MTKRNYYEVLGVSKNADADVIKRVSERLMNAYHPDKNPDSASEGKFKEVQEAYACLIDPVKRKAYDEEMGAGNAESSQSATKEAAATADMQKNATVGTKKLTWGILMAAAVLVVFAAFLFYPDENKEDSASIAVSSAEENAESNRGIKAGNTEPPKPGVPQQNKVENSAEQESLVADKSTTLDEEGKVEEASAPKSESTPPVEVEDSTAPAITVADKGKTPNREKKVEDASASKPEDTQKKNEVERSVAPETPKVKSELARLQELAEHGDPDDQFKLGRKYESGDGVQPNKAEAVKWYKAAAEQGHADAQFNLGLMYRDGEGVLEDKAKAVTLFKAAAKGGNDDARSSLIGMAYDDHAEAQLKLGGMYYKGEGVPEGMKEEDRLKKAFKWYEKAAEQGNVDAQFGLGVMYYKGEGVEKDEKKAVKWYKAAAAQGDDEALSSLMTMADGGHAEAQLKLGGMYYKGEGVYKIYAEAARWYKMAADQGDVDAQFGLGVMYYNGEGVPPNKAEAYIWFWLVADSGDKEGEESKRLVAKYLTEYEIREAEKEAKRRARSIDRNKQN